MDRALGLAEEIVVPFFALALLGQRLASAYAFYMLMLPARPSRTVHVCVTFLCIFAISCYLLVLQHLLMPSTLGFLGLGYVRRLRKRLMLCHFTLSTLSGKHRTTPVT